MSTAEILHKRFNKRHDQIPPARVKNFTRKDLAKLFAELGYARGAEIGVADGQNSLIICEANPGLVLDCIDPWVVYRDNPRAHDNQEEMLAKAHERLDQYNVKFVRAKSMEVVFDYPDGSLDFVYIDGHHGFDYVMSDLIWWARKVRKDGIVALHDYYRFRWAGVVDAVDAYIRAHQIHEWFVTDEREPTVFWAKA